MDFAGILDRLGRPQSSLHQPSHLRTSRNRRNARSFGALCKAFASPTMARTYHKPRIPLLLQQALQVKCRSRSIGPLIFSLIKCQTLEYGHMATMQTLLLVSLGRTTKIAFSTMPTTLWLNSKEPSEMT